MCYYSFRWLGKQRNLGIVGLRPGRAVEACQTLVRSSPVGARHDAKVIAEASDHVTNE